MVFVSLYGKPPPNLPMPNTLDVVGIKKVGLMVHQAAQTLKAFAGLVSSRRSGSVGKMKNQIAAAWSSRKSGCAGKFTVLQLPPTLVQTVNISPYLHGAGSDIHSQS